MAARAGEDRFTTVGLFLEAHAGLSRELERRLAADCGLSVQWFEVLVRLIRTPGERLRMTDLASQTTLTPSGLTRAVDRLVEQGFVERTTCPSDGRGMYAVLTDTGRTRIGEAMIEHLRHLDDVLDGVLTAEDERHLAAVCRKLRDALHAAPTTAG